MPAPVKPPAEPSTVAAPIVLGRVRAPVTETEPEQVDEEPSLEPPAAVEGPEPYKGSPLLAGLISLTTGIGLLFEGYAMAVAPKNNGLGQLCFWIGMVVPFGIYLTVLMRPQLGRLREVIIAIIGVYATLVYRMSSALVLGGYDEHLHDQELRNLLLGSGLFSGNPILKAGPYYPGLELFTGALVRLTDTPIILGESIAVLIARLLLVLLIYQGALLVSPSRRGASLVVVFYAASQQFYGFNSQFAYQTLAVTLGLGGLVMLRRAQLSGRGRTPGSFWVALLTLVATVVTHHITGLLVLGFLFAWTWATPKDRRRLLSRASLIMGIAALIWTAALAKYLWAYLEPIEQSVVQSAQQYLHGTTGHQLFGAEGGAPANPLWEGGVLVGYELGCVFAALACAWIMLRGWRRTRDRMLFVLGFLDLMFPVTGVSHFDPSVGAIGDRASTFLFFPLALSVSLIIRRDPRVAKPGKPPRDLFRPALLRALILGTTFIFLGGTLLGSAGDWGRLPGSYLVSAEARSQDPETLAAVRWAGDHIPAGSTIVADRIPGALLEGQARLWPLGEPIGNLQPAYLYFSPTWDYQDSVIVKGLHIDYLYVDARLTESLPYDGFYISQGETPTSERITKGMLAKFAKVKGLTVAYQHGPVTIYNTYGLGVVPKRQGFNGYNAMGAGGFDALFGAAAVLVVMFFRRRLGWVRTAARDSGAVGAATGVMAVAIFVAALLFELRVFPGPAFTLGAIGAGAVILGVSRRRSGQSVIPRVRLRWPRVNWLILIGLAAGIAGLLICLRGSWVTDYSDVQDILRSVRK
jgi:hypothetical protein